jgi:hypothetical protein
MVPTLGTLATLAAATALVLGGGILALLRRRRGATAVADATETVVSTT